VRFACAAAFGVTVTLLACGGDDSSNGSSQSQLPPNGCPAEPCKVGTICFQQPEPTCNGTWYCHADQKWYCAPEDAGGPGGSPPDGAFMQETGGGSMDASMTDAKGGG
jgi:hypothetical protein